MIFLSMAIEVVTKKQTKKLSVIIENKKHLFEQMIALWDAQIQVAAQLHSEEKKERPNL